MLRKVGQSERTNAYTCLKLLSVCICTGQEERLRVDKVYEVILQIEANGIAIVPQETSSTDDRRAIALYASASMFNHSCDSPLSLSFQHRSIRVQSNANLPAGSRLDICYGPQVHPCCDWHLYESKVAGRLKICQRFHSTHVRISMSHPSFTRQEWKVRLINTSMSLHSLFDNYSADYICHLALHICRCFAVFSRFLTSG